MIEYSFVEISSIESSINAAGPNAKPSAYETQGSNQVGVANRRAAGRKLADRAIRQRRAAAGPGCESAGAALPADLRHDDCRGFGRRRRGAAGIWDAALPRDRAGNR